MSFGPVKKQKVAAQVADAIRQAIISGQLQAGQSLPAERALAAQFGVNRSSIREALLRLEAWGLITIRHGESTRIEDVFEVGGLQMLPYLLMPNGDIDADLLGDVLSIRVMFLKWTGEQAALRGPEADLAELQTSLAELAAADSPAAAQAADWRFFEQLVSLTENRVLRICVHALREIYKENPEQMLLLYSDIPFDVTGHQTALTAIAAGDSHAAGAAMEAYGLVPLGGHYVANP